MVNTSYLLSSLALLCAATAAPTSDHRPSSPHAKAVYFMTDAKDGNSVVALKVGANGLLEDGSITSTGGKGASGFNAANNAPAGPDALFSQGAVGVGADMVVVVNPGSNTLSLLNIDRHDPTKLRLIGKPVDTLGDFPMSVAVSEKLKTACVANSGAKNGIACFSMDSRRGLEPLDKSLRSFGLNQTTPPNGPPNTVSHTLFNEDSSLLLTTVKGAGTPGTGSTGFLSIFPVERGRVSHSETRSSPKSTDVLFGTVNIPNTNTILVTDASFGATTLALKHSRNDSTTVKTVASTHIANQGATCWSAYSAHTKTVFVTDATQNRLVEIIPATGAIASILDVNNDNPAMIDLASGGNFVYALSPGAANVSTAIAVFDVSGGKGKARAVQNFNPKAFSGITAQGLAVSI